MEGEQKFHGMNTLPFSSLYKRWNDTVGFKPAGRAGTEAYFPEYHYFSQGLFGVIICGCDTGDTQKSGEMFLLRTGKESSQCFGRFEPERFFADILQFPNKTLFDIRGLLPGDLAGF